MHKKSFVVDPTGRGRTKGAGVLKFDNEADAQAALLRDMLADGAVKGISAAVQRALTSNKDVDKALKEALKVQEVELLLEGMGGQIEKQFRAFEKQAAERVRIAKQYGFDLVKLEEINGKERQQLAEKLLDQQVGSLKKLVDEMTFGSKAEGTALERRDKLLEAIAKTRADVEAGKEGAANTLAQYYGQLLTLSREAFGSSAAYMADREMILNDSNAIIDRHAAEIEAIRSGGDPVVASALDENNQQNAKMLDELKIANGGLAALLKAWVAGKSELYRQGTVVV